MKNGQHASKAAIALRRKRELEMLAQGLTQKETANQLGISRVTLWRDLTEIEALVRAELPDDYRKKLLVDLGRLRGLIATGRISDGRRIELMLGVIDRETKLAPRGTVAPQEQHKRITVRFIGGDASASQIEPDRAKRQLADAQFEGERRLGVQDALNMETPLLEGKVEGQDDDES